MKSCQNCGGAVFFGGGAIGWGGPICRCPHPILINSQIGQGGASWPAVTPPRTAEQRIEELVIGIDMRLKRIEAKLDTSPKPEKE